jgi:hypothetical protein
VYVIPRKAMRGVNRVYMVEQDPPELARREITPLWSTAHEVIVKTGFIPGEKLSTSTLTYAVDGAKVEIVTPPVDAVKEEHQEKAKPRS